MMRMSTPCASKRHPPSWRLCQARHDGHECATRWLEDGLDVREIQVLLGHSKLEITQRYLNITDAGVVRSMRELWVRRRATVAGAES